MRHTETFCLLAAALLGLVLPNFSLAQSNEERDADRRQLREAGIGTDAAALLAYFNRLAPTPAEEQRLDRLVRQLGDPQQAQRDRAGWDLLAAGPLAQRRLRHEVANADPEVAARARRLLAAFERGPGIAVTIAAAHELADLRPTGAIASFLRAMPYLDDTSAEQEVIAALEALDQLGTMADAALWAALSDRYPARRAAAAAVLGRRADLAQSAVVRPLLTDPISQAVTAALTIVPEAAVRPLLADPEPAVRWQAACALAAARDRAAVPVLIQLVAGPDDLSWQAEAWLYRLAGEPGPELPPGDDPSSRQKRRHAWAEWWAIAAPSADLGRLAAAPVPLHLTLLTHMHSGRVVEINRDGKEVWSIAGLNGPIDAQVVPGGRVVVAEHGGRQVAEYDRSGRALWVKPLSDSPVVCQRLPSGNFFVVTYTAIYELGPYGNEISRHPSPGGMRLYAGQRLPGGRAIVATVDGQALELDVSSGRVLKSQQLACPGCYGIERLPNGHILTASYNLDRVREFDAAGRIVWEVSLPKPYHATRLPNGHTLVSSASHARIVEVDRAGHIVWERTTSNPCWHLHRR